MCGIVGYTGPRQAAPILLDGLSRLEYRGYDSAGIAVLGLEERFQARKAVGRLDALRHALDSDMPEGRTGIAHTRWATHGRPTVDNAHPHMDCHNRVAVVQNGIVENYLPLKQALRARGHAFLSQTDTEVLPHLIEERLADGLALDDAVREGLRDVVGAMALVVSAVDQPEALVAVRSGNAGGLLVGLGEGDMFIASDLPALLPYTRRVVYLNSGDAVTVTPQGARFWGLADGKALVRKPQTVAQDPVSVAKEGYKHFMLKEIAQQPDVLTDVIRGRVDLEAGALYLEEMDGLALTLRAVSRVLFTGCGSSFHAALLGRRYMEDIARLPSEAEVASELRYRNILLGPDTLVVSVAQSGETVDTLAAMEMARALGAPQVTLSNVAGSQSTRIADATLLLRAGPEVSVAATKTFTASAVTLYLLALHMGVLRGTVPPNASARLLTDLARLPALVGAVLQKASTIEDLARKLYRKQDMVYLGRGAGYPIALEGALKLKEVSYIHAEGIAGGEMKHGPIALVDENMPVVAIALQDAQRDKMLGNIEEIKARDGSVIALLSDGDTDLAERVDHAILVPPISPALSPVLAAVPLQLFAYYIGVLRGADVDQPRNLAKSVTVE